MVCRKPYYTANLRSDHSNPQKNSVTHPWTKPILRWAGSKRRLIPTLMAAMPLEFNRYIEPFAGSACLFFATHPTSALLGDVNSSLIECYKILRSHPRKLSRAVRTMKFEKSEYYRIRAIKPSTLNAFERASRFVYLNRLCFNGVYRTNRTGEFNVPFGSHQGEAPSEHDFFRCSYALRSAELFTGDFEDCISNSRKGDFVYLDPPYSSTARPRYGEYGYESFQPLEISRLRTALQLLDDRNVRFLLSYSDTVPHRNAFVDWKTHSLSVRRHVAGFTVHRNIVPELLISNFDWDFDVGAVL